MPKKSSCQRTQFKHALKELVDDMGYSTANRVPKHMRRALRSHAWNLAAVRCNIAKTGQPYSVKRATRTRKRWASKARKSP